MIAMSSLKEDDPYRDLREANPKALICLGYEDAYMGFTVARRPVATYDYDACIDIVIDEGDLTEEEAAAYFYYYTLSKCQGVKNAPLFVRVR